MRKYVLIFFLISAIQISAQSVEKDYSKSRFEFGFFSGVSSESFKYLDECFFAEVCYKITPKWIIKMSVGKSSVLKEDKSTVFVYNPFVDSLHSMAHEVKGFDYTIIPASVGMEYLFAGEKTIPYLLAELGVNSYKSSRVIGFIKRNYGVPHPNSDDTVVSNYRFIDPWNGSSFRFAFGLGIKLISGGFINLDVRYLYQINTNVVNNHLILIGANLLQ